KIVPPPKVVEPEGNEKISDEKLSTTIVVNPDGTILFQDMNLDLAKIAKQFQNP
ncbi:MAG: hypothetical protein GXP32_07345, partial [Kiritimatiellaeota bacterium]|nr:hypothetical protein [Kiritimatiellota bacterium]